LRSNTPVQNSNHLERDWSSGAIINTDTTGYNNAILAAKRAKEKDARLDNLENDINIIKNELQGLMSILKDKFQD
jgi:hypothetical protein